MFLTIKHHSLKVAIAVVIKTLKNDGIMKDILIFKLICFNFKGKKHEFLLLNIFVISPKIRTFNFVQLTYEYSILGNFKKEKVHFGLFKDLILRINISIHTHIKMHYYINNILCFKLSGFSFYINAYRHIIRVTENDLTQNCYISEKMNEMKIF